ncbi:MAG TPA: GNAT family N-acetyltransferase [Candidatus Scatavimonas merdigallinarum]|uniref:GNAT family N-acetyltransferase n=1 Tax=Candidatus Scatavimonas merdigallinarum TaxID=2840914 RepID=A0A9D0ZLE1_9FIRM|nr:GNAT family N-acetyltransferase [Candidatus Scatavimonas merdigallinarum]
MEYKIRQMNNTEYLLLNDFLYEAIYVPSGIEPPPKTVIYFPELQVYVADFGKKEHDIALVAEVNQKIIGAVWVRIMNDYGHIDNTTPSLAMSVFKEYRGLGVGTALLKELISLLKSKGYSRISLSVQKDNYAVKMYQKIGFTILKEVDEEYIMVIAL